MKEVLSVPGGQTQAIIKKYLVHAHPHPRSYKVAQHMAIRESGGIMDTLYSIQGEFVLRPLDDDLGKSISILNEDFQNRLKGYIAERTVDFGFGEKDEYKFYLLTVNRELNHQPRSLITLPGHTYFTLGELISGREIVLSESKLNEQ
ncbi:hypothetical protein FQV26_13475 [Planococcus sp. CPCC 101016]|uniref:hypothetical protein n=1 Tax=Planococcus sp. CPCC 101016 TaxID=2599617 RepID=UPI0011B784E7|nr:hypothetical protein [Planococcus sp. CPCC 101016]TWT05438.1 hypothetical protein FQV26_13475 [Planococcus sp. CPCC 101016]